MDKTRDLKSGQGDVSPRTSFPMTEQLNHTRCFLALALAPLMACCGWSVVGTLDDAPVDPSATTKLSWCIITVGLDRK
jgi:hypothetical protein